MTARAANRLAAMMFMMLVAPLRFLRSFVGRDWLEHAEALFQRLMRKRGPGNIVERQFRVGDAVEEVPQERQPAKRLVVEIDQRPRRELCVSRRQHLLARFGVIVIMPARLDIDW